MQFKEVLLARHAVRYFEDTPVDDTVIRNLVEQATRAPSWINAQEWKVWAATGQALENIRTEFFNRAEADIKGQSDVPVSHREAFSNFGRENMQLFTKAREDAGLGRIKLDSQAHLFHAPVMLFLTLPKTYTPYMLFDLGAFSQTLMLAAADIGLGSLVAWNPVKYPDIIRKYLSIPPEEAIAIAIALGFEKNHALNTFRSTRRSVEQILKIVR
ncbi:MAG TPA: nitroreductase [Sutterella sp.]|nr:nitroreductase [Sutterella sp.]